MGTTESIFYDPKEGEVRSNETRFPSRDLSDHPASHSQRSTSHASSINAQRRPLRPRPTTLKGVILGLQSSGKRTLLQRLSGKDPFASKEEVADAAAQDGGATVPYQPPSGATVWDRIQLQVVLPESNDGNALDFYVVLVNPRHDAKRVREYITKTVIPELVGQAGSGEEHGANSDKKKRVCLCLLLNFRDLRDDMSETGSKPERIQPHNLQKWAEKALAKHATLSAERVILECGSTSLRNCYGLSRLHHFIYRVYMLRKQAELEERLLEVRSGLANARETVPEQSYEEFLSFLEQTQAGSELNSTVISATTRSDTEPRSNGAQATERQETVHQGALPAERAVAPSPTSKKRAARLPPVRSSVKPRPVLPMKHPQVDRKKALDDFFADDEDEETHPVMLVPAPLLGVPIGGTDEEEDDFFYDEKGNRHDGMLDSKASSGEESIELGRKSPDEGTDDVGAPNLEKTKGSKSVPAGAFTKRPESSESLVPPGKEHEEASSLSQPAPTESLATGIPEENNSGNGRDGWDDDDIDLDRSNDQADAYEDTTAPQDQEHEDRSRKEQARPPESDQVQADQRSLPFDEGSDKVISSPKEQNATIDNADSAQATDFVKPATNGGDLSDDGSKGEKTDSVDLSLVLVEGGRPALSGDPEQERNHSAGTRVAVTQAASHSSFDVAQISDGESNDGEFIVEGTEGSTEQSRLSIQKATHPTTDDKTTASVVGTGSPSTGISAAALAAIAAAEQEAQAMLDEVEHPSSPQAEKQKKPKKKKDPDAKKKKKRKKEKKRTIETDSA